MNIGAEYFQFLMAHYFDPDRLQTFDVRTVVRQLKRIEMDSFNIICGNNERSKIKYKFFPLETY
jgi:hypothetical protein